MTITIETIQAKARSFMSAAEAHYGRPFPNPSIRTDLKGVVAGWAYLRKFQVGLNKTFLERHPEDMLNQTLPHELAHLITHILYPYGKAHGKEWKSVMRVLGCPPDRCHNYDTSDLGTWKQDTWAYSCACPGRTHQISTTRHNRAKRNMKVRGGTGYHCRQCKTSIVMGGSKREEFRKIAQKAAEGTPNKKWSPKPGSKGALALDIYKDILWMEDRLIVDYLMKKMNIKKANARAYLAKCKQA